MKSYLTVFCKWIQGCALVSAACGMSGCLPGWIAPVTFETFAQRPLPAYVHAPALLIAPFENSAQSPALAMKVARLFLTDSIHSGAVTHAGIIDNADVLRSLQYRDSPVAPIALKSARRRGADLLLSGSVTTFLPGSTGNTRVTIIAKLIDVDSGTLLWWGRCTTVGTSGRTMLLWDFRLTPNPPDADALLKRAVGKTVKKIFPPGTLLFIPSPDHDGETLNAADMPAHDAPDAEHAADDTDPTHVDPVPVSPEIHITSPDGDLPPDALDQAYEELRAITEIPDYLGVPAN